MIQWRPSQAMGAALALSAVAVAAVLVWIRWDAADAWMPNLATTAVGLAVGLTLVERILRRDERRRLEPLRKWAVWNLMPELRSYCTCLSYDYLATHSNPKPLPTDDRALYALWLEEHQTEDVDRANESGGDPPGVVRVGIALADVFGEARLIYGPEILTVDLIEAMERFINSSKLTARMFLDPRGRTPTTTAFSALSILVGNAQAICDVLVPLLGGDERCFAGADNQALALGRVSDAWFDQLPRG
jgi:hypothetical protein